MKDKYYLLFSILRTVFQNKKMNEADKKLLNDEMFQQIIEIAQKHDIAHLIAIGMLNNHLVPEKYVSDVQKLAYMAIVRYEKLNFEFCRVCDIFEKAEIPFIPLKGAVMRNYYPEPWMRTSCDIDILIHESDLLNAVTCLNDSLKYTKDEEGTHDISLLSPQGIRLELHYNLIEDGVAKASSSVLGDIWNTTVVKKDCCYHHEMTDEVFYFYHISHMAKHFENGGCGIRPFIDLWLLEKNCPPNNGREDLLKRGGLQNFASIAVRLSKVWMESYEYDAITSKVERYIIEAGVYGSVENSVKIECSKEKGRWEYLFKKIFLPTEQLKKMYPFLHKYPWLMPLMQVRRWINKIFVGISPKTKAQLKANRNITNKDIDNIKHFLREIGL